VRVLTYVQTYALARSVGLGHEEAIIATAVAKGESGLRTDAVGDTTLTDATWGPSVGLWQVRSVKAETGTGGTRDVSRLRDPAFNARSMASISSHGRNWSPWSVYTNGTYRAHVAAVRRAVGDGSQVPIAPAVGAAQAAGLPDPSDLWEGFKKGTEVVPKLPGLIGGEAAESVVGAVLDKLLPVVLIGTAVAGGFALIGVGLWRATSRGSS